MHERNREKAEQSNVTKWYDEGYKGQNVTVAVLDDEGASHTDYIELPFDNHQGVGHKTNVISVVHEFAPLAKIQGFNVTGKKSNMEESIDHLLKKPPDIINISATIRVYPEQIERLRQLDIPIVCASGNQGIDKVSYPANADFTIAVGAYEASYSNHGKTLDCVGFTNIFVPNSKQNWYPFGGTSCATPYVTALLACYISWRKDKGLPKLTAGEARRFIKQNCIDLNEEGRDDKTGHGLFILPNILEVRRLEEWRGYRVTSGYGNRKDPFTGKDAFHTGIDLVMYDKAPIRAFTSGEVIHARRGEIGSGFGGFGIVVAIKDKTGSLHCYCHLDSIACAEGDKVSKGDVIGYQGSTGRSTGSHLHYEVREKSSPSYGWQTHTDPVKYLDNYKPKGKSEMTKKDANKIIGLLQATFKVIEDTTAHTEAEKEVSRLANEVRKAAGMEVN